MQILCHNLINFTEVRFYFIKTYEGEPETYALVSLYSPPNKFLLKRSHGTLIVCRYQDEAVLVVVNVKSILSVVAMVPFQYAVDMSILSMFGLTYPPKKVLLPLPSISLFLLSPSLPLLIKPVLCLSSLAKQLLY